MLPGGRYRKPRLAPGIYGGGPSLIGNFGDGPITAYNPTTYAYLKMAC